MPTKPYANLKEFDLVLCRADSFITEGIQWMQSGLGCKSPEFIHVIVALVKDGELKLFQTNPPAPSYRLLGDLDWNPDKTAVLAYNLPESQETCLKARSWADLRLSSGADPYGFSSILGFAGLGLFGRVWPSAARAILGVSNPVASQAKEVCSQLVDDLFLDCMGRDILPGVGRGQALPGDMTLSVCHSHAYGRLGA